MQCPTCRRPLREDLAACPGCGADLTYWVQGADGKRYGPYPLAEVRRYAAEGRVPPNAMVSQAGAPWQPLSQALAPSPGGVARPAAARAKRGVSPVAIVFIVIGGLFVLGLIGGAVLLGGGRSAARSQARSRTCRSHLMQIALGALMSSQDHNEVFPDATTWKTDLEPYLKNTTLYQCPASTKGDQSYEMNPALSRMPLSQVMNPTSTPLFYDAGFPNGTPPHPEGWNVAFADGHCKSVTASEASQYMSQ